MFQLGNMLAAGTLLGAAVIRFDVQTYNSDTLESAEILLAGFAAGFPVITKLGPPAVLGFLACR